MRLTILTQYYPPEIGAPQRRLSDLARRLVEAGYEVTVLTAMPNYPTGKIHAGYGGIFKREQIDGVNVIRTFIYPTQKASLLHRLTNYFSFVLSSALIGTFRLPRTDLLLVESPPLFLGFTGYWLSRIKRARLIFNVSDLWPESAVRLDMLTEDSRAYKLAAWLEKFCYEKSWLITGQSKSILADIAARFPACATFHLSNGVDVQNFGADQRMAQAEASINAGVPDRSEKTVIMYAGLHGLAQGLAQVLDAAADLQARDAACHFVLIGAGPEKQDLVNDAQTRGLTNITFLDPRPASEIPALLACADILLVPLKMYIPGAVPSKLYEAMASEKPVILVAQGEAADIVHQHESGIVVEPGDIAGLVRAITSLHEDENLRAQMGQKGRAAAETHYNRAAIASSFAAYLEAHTGL
ncbi:MAG: glycosyltransferase family 4 protein [Anaerolineae bacterium]|nr:glycosyltransferase family 4 protein [Anaerolineae bacterium]